MTDTGRTTAADPGALLGPCQAVLIVPPFGPLDRPSLGVHLLQACAREAGFSVGVVYANLWFARWIGERAYQSIGQMPVTWLIGERLFCRQAYDTPPLGHDRAAHVLAIHRQLTTNEDGKAICGSRRIGLSLEGLLALETQAVQWLADFAPRLAHACPTLVGSTSTFEQTAPGLALLRAIARARPDTVRIIGGANCEDEMAEGIRAIAPFVDVVFSGESEATFVAFLHAFSQGRLPSGPIVRGLPCNRLDALPTPDFSDYYRQLAAVLPDGPIARDGQGSLPYESSRGCWWGQKSHCTFCGLNGEGMGFRAKSPDRVISELRELSTRHPGKTVAMADNIMPHEYFRTLLPRIQRELPPLRLFYEQKSNLTLAHMRTLADAGVTAIQPGIEALSSGLLTLMRKGVSAGQNIAALRYARVCGVDMQWNLLCGFPGDDLAFYRETLALLPLLRHLHPPTGIVPIVISRFSPYFTQPAAFGIDGLCAFEAYRDVLPVGAPADKVAYFFEARFTSASRARNEVVAAIADELALWNRTWHGGGKRPELHVRVRPHGFDLVDSRGLTPGDAVTPIDADQAMLALTGKATASHEPSLLAWGQERRVIVQHDARWIPLATADVAVLETMERLSPKRTPITQRQTKPLRQTLRKRPTTLVPTT